MGKVICKIWNDLDIKKYLKYGLFNGASWIPPFSPLGHAKGR